MYVFAHVYVYVYIYLYVYVSVYVHVYVYVNVYVYVCVYVYVKHGVSCSRLGVLVVSRCTCAVRSLGTPCGLGALCLAFPLESKQIVLGHT